MKGLLLTLGDNSTTAYESCYGQGKVVRVQSREHWRFLSDTKEDVNPFRPDQECVVATLCLIRWPIKRGVLCNSSPDADLTLQSAVEKGLRFRWYSCLSRYLHASGFQALRHLFGIYHTSRRLSLSSESCVDLGVRLDAAYSRRAPRLKLLDWSPA